MDTNDLTRTFLWQIGKTAIAVIITVLVGLLGVQLELRHRVLLAISIFIGLSVIEALWVIKRVDKRLVKHHDIWVHVSDIDLLLGSIRANYRSLKDSASGEKDLFIRHFDKSIRKLNDELNEAANSGRLITNAGYFLSIEHTLNAYVRSTEKIWRFTWRVDNPTELLAIGEWVAWFRHCVELVQQKKMAGIKTIFIIEDESVASHPHLEKLFEFYRSVKGIECKTATRLNFSTACRALKIDEQKAADMGIYGDSLLYVNHSDEPEIMGEFHRDKGTIGGHKALFDTIWDSKDFSRDIANNKKNGNLTFDQLVSAMSSL